MAPVSDSTTDTAAIVRSNNAPCAYEASFRVLHDRELTGQLYGYDPDGDTITAQLVSGPAHGTLTLNADGSFTYTPDTHYVGADSFTYTWTDGLDVSGVATVEMGVYNDPPTAEGESFMLQPGESFAVFLSDNIPPDYRGRATTLSQLLANDWDPDGDPPEFVRTGELSQRWHFDSGWNAWVFRASSDFTGVDDSFEYFVTDRIPVNRPYSDTYNEDETYPYSSSWRVCMLLQVGGGGGGGGPGVSIFFAVYERTLEDGRVRYTLSNSLQLSGLEGAFERVNENVTLKKEYVAKDPKRFILRINDPNADKTPGPGNDRIKARIVTFDEGGRVLDGGNDIILKEKPDAAGQFWSDDLLLVAHPNDDKFDVPIAEITRAILHFWVNLVEVFGPYTRQALWTHRFQRVIHCV